MYLELAYLLYEYLLTSRITSPSFLLLAIDLEFYKRDHHIVTKIGLASSKSTIFIDADIRPTEEHCAHYIITENKGYRHGKFVADNQDKYNFGLSREVSLGDVGEVIIKDVLVGSRGLPIILVRHSVQGDLEKLKEVGCCLEEEVTIELDIAIAF